jgi:uncharacterized protein YutE (UPF0331/DUF86 family)
LNAPTPLSREIVLTISSVSSLEGLEADKLSRWVKFRNIITHEYLDLKWNSISKFIGEVELLYKNFTAIIRRYIQSELESENEG